MENQHRKIKGYRELSQAEIDLMNEVKQKGVELGALLSKLESHIHKHFLDTKNNHDEIDLLTFVEPKRWLSIARTDLQKGLMAATRAIAQPDFF